MFMGQLIVVGMVFAIAVILVSVWQLVADKREYNPDALDEARDEFQQRVKNWQREQRAKRASLKTSAHIVASNKQRPVQRIRRTPRRRARRLPSNPVRQQFELID